MSLHGDYDETFATYRLFAPRLGIFSSCRSERRGVMGKRATQCEEAR